MEEYKFDYKFIQKNKKISKKLIDKIHIIKQLKIQELLTTNQQNTLNEIYMGTNTTTKNINTAQIFLSKIKPKDLLDKCQNFNKFTKIRNMLKNITSDTCVYCNINKFMFNVCERHYDKYKNKFYEILCDGLSSKFEICFKILKMELEQKNVKNKKNIDITKKFIQYYEKKINYEQIITYLKKEIKIEK